MISKAISLIKDFWKRSKLFSAIQKKIDNRFRKRLKNDGFTILCSNCIGGCIYHRLGKQFLTPTINMFMMQPDFIKFLLHLDYYLAEPLQFIASSEPTPVARVGGEKTMSLKSLCISTMQSRRMKPKIFGTGEKQG